MNLLPHLDTWIPDVFLWVPPPPSFCPIPMVSSVWNFGSPGPKGNPKVNTHHWESSLGLRKPWPWSDLLAKTPIRAAQKIRSLETLPPHWLRWDFSGSPPSPATTFQSLEDFLHFSWLDQVSPQLQGFRGGTWACCLNWIAASEVCWCSLPAAVAEWCPLSLDWQVMAPFDLLIPSTVDNGTVLTGKWRIKCSSHLRGQKSLAGQPKTHLHWAWSWGWRMSLGTAESVPTMSCGVHKTHVFAFFSLSSSLLFFFLSMDAQQVPYNFW